MASSIVMNLIITVFFFMVVSFVERCGSFGWIDPFLAHFAFLCGSSFRKREHLLFYSALFGFAWCVQIISVHDGLVKGVSVCCHRVSSP